MFRTTFQFHYYDQNSNMYMSLMNEIMFAPPPTWPICYINISSSSLFNRSNFLTI